MSVDTVERVRKEPRGEVSEIRGMPGWEGLRIQKDSGAIDAVGPKEIDCQGV